MIFEQDTKVLDQKKVHFYRCLHPSHFSLTGGETPSTPSVDVGDFFSVTWYGGICWHCGCRLVIMAVVDPHLGKGLQDLPPIGITGSHYLDDDPVGCVSPRMQQLQHPLVDEQ